MLIPVLRVGATMALGAALALLLRALASRSGAPPTSPRRAPAARRPRGTQDAVTRAEIAPTAGEATTRPDLGKADDDAPTTLGMGEGVEDATATIDLGEAADERPQRKCPLGPEETVPATLLYLLDEHPNRVSQAAIVERLVVDYHLTQVPEAEKRIGKHLSALWLRHLAGKRDAYLVSKTFDGLALTPYGLEQAKRLRAGEGWAGAMARGRKRTAVKAG